MHLSSRILSAALAAVLAVSALCLPVSAAKYDTLTFPDAAGSQVTYLDQQYQDIAELPIGTQIILTGMPDYNAAYNDGQYNYVGFNTDKGTWYIRLGSSSVDALKKIVPNDGSITEFTACGTYVGLLAANGLPVIYCDDHQIDMFCIRNQDPKNEEKLLPPIILLGHNFSPSNFCKESGQQCDVLDNHDFALSLLNMIPSYNDIYSKFQFNDGSSNFISKLEPATTVAIPRIRTMRSTGTHKVWYIEKANNEFAKVEQGMLPWGSIICHHEMNAPMVIKQKDYSVYLPATLLLPSYVERALYLMNLGLPEIKKVFVCGNSSNTYYTLMNQYKLHNETRCDVFASKISGSDNKSNLVRDVVRTTHRMEFYKSNFNGSKYRDMYMILKDCNGADEILAVAHKHKVYLNRQGQFYRLDTRSVNEAMSFLIQDGWVFGSGRKSIGYSKDGGLTFESVFTLTDEVIELPDLSQFHKEDIQII